MNSALTARTIGAAFGLVFVVVNGAVLDAPWSWVLRALAVAAFVGVLLRLRWLGETVVRPRGSAIRIYWTSVILEVLALVIGARLLATAHHGEYGAAWVAFVVGIHFLPFAWAFRQPAFRGLGVALILLAIAGAATGLLGAGDAVIAVVAGVGAGVALLVFAAAPSSLRTNEP